MTTEQGAGRGGSSAGRSIQGEGDTGMSDEHTPNCEAIEGWPNSYPVPNITHGGTMTKQEQGAVQSAVLRPALFVCALERFIEPEGEAYLRIAPSEEAIRERDAAIRAAAIEECAVVLAEAGDVDCDTQYASGWYAGVQAGLRRIRVLADEAQR
jgi:hypothetical protein